MNKENLIKFLHLCGKLKELKRTGWVEAGVSNPESVADHVFRTTLFSMILSDDKGLDTLKVMRMALIHDLSEALTGDLTPAQKTPSYINDENEAMKQLLTLLPNRLMDNYTVAWQEYQLNTTPEAKIVHEADKLEMLLQASEYEAAGESDKRLQHFWDTKISSAYTELVNTFRTISREP